MTSSALVLFSGGIDSTTATAVAIEQGFQPAALSILYGQRHRIEVEQARLVLRQFGGLEHIILSIDLTQIGGSALTSKQIDVPKHRAIDHSIPSTYVPGRNLIFLSLAAAVGEVHGISDIFFGANVLDYSGYPDCRPEFIESLERTINLGTKSGLERRFRIHAPLLQMTKADIIRTGLRLNVDYTNTHSCYDPSPAGESCGVCDSCQLRLKGFGEAGIPDPARYVKVAHE